MPVTSVKTPVSSLVSLTAHWDGVSPISILPIGIAHCPVSRRRCRSSRPSWSTASRPQAGTRLFGVGACGSCQYSVRLKALALSLAASGVARAAVTGSGFTGTRLAGTGLAGAGLAGAGLAGAGLAGAGLAGAGFAGRAVRGGLRGAGLGEQFLKPGAADTADLTVIA